MVTVEEVRETMRATGLFSEDALNGLTQEIIDHGIKNAKPIPASQVDVHIVSTWQGNHFRIVEGKWNWDNAPGSPCERTLTWEYTPRPGASYREVGRCPQQGYPWFEMQIPA